MLGVGAHEAPQSFHGADPDFRALHHLVRYVGTDDVVAAFHQAIGEAPGSAR
jgi:hypothetical protein